MRSEDELRKAAEAVRWYWGSGRVRRQDSETVNNILGVTAAVEWVLGEGETNPVAGMLKDIAQMRQQPGNN